MDWENLGTHEILWGTNITISLCVMFVWNVMHDFFNS